MSKTTFHYYDFISKTDSHTHAITVWTKQTVPKMSEEILVNLISTVFKLSESKWLLRIYNLWENKKFKFYVNVDYIQWKQNKLSYIVLVWFKNSIGCQLFKFYRLETLYAVCYYRYMHEFSEMYLSPKLLLHDLSLRSSCLISKSLPKQR